jgi:hypothetical protein
VIDTIMPPDSWTKLFKYVVGAGFAGKPSPAAAREGMSEMLDAVRTGNCREDAELAETLTGRR